MNDVSDVETIETTKLTTIPLEKERHSVGKILTEKDGIVWITTNGSSVSITPGNIDPPSSKDRRKLNPEKILDYAGDAFSLLSQGKSLSIESKPYSKSIGAADTWSGEKAAVILAISHQLSGFEKSRTTVLSSEYSFTRTGITDSKNRELIVVHSQISKNEFQASKLLTIRYFTREQVKSIQLGKPIISI